MKECFNFQLQHFCWGWGIYCKHLKVDLPLNFIILTHLIKILILHVFTIHLVCVYGCYIFTAPLAFMQATCHNYSIYYETIIWHFISKACFHYNHLALGLNFHQKTWFYRQTLSLSYICLLVFGKRMRNCVHKEWSELF